MILERSCETPNYIFIILFINIILFYLFLDFIILSFNNIYRDFRCVSEQRTDFYIKELKNKE